MNKNDCYIAEYSPSQNKFHCDFLKVSIERNIRAINNNEPSDWITVGVYDSWKEAQEFIEKFKKQLNS